MKNKARQWFEITQKHHRETFSRAVREQKADPKIIPLCRFINQQPDFFSASSCSGRIVLLELDSHEKKRESAFFFKKHARVRTDEIYKRLRQKSRQTLWFKQEPFILHLGTDSLSNANRLLLCCRRAGIKRAGIMVAKTGKFVLEIIGTHGFSVPVKEKNTMLITKPFLNKLVNHANKKLGANFKRLQKLEHELRHELERTA